MRKACILVIAITLACPTFAVDQTREQKRLSSCGQVFKEIMDIPDEIPKDLLNKAECVIVIPSVLKFAFGVGGDFGRGAVSCRTGQHFTGPWSAPAMFALEGANIGFQIGGEATDYVLLVMNPRGANSILSSKVKLGADASAAAGPKGRTAAADTDIVMRAEVLGIPALAVCCLRVFHSRAQHFGLMAVQIRNSMGRVLVPKRSSAKAKSESQLRAANGSLC